MNVGMVYCHQEEDESEIDEEEDEVDPAELDGLADEANLSVEELLKRYPGMYTGPACNQYRWPR